MLRLVFYIISICQCCYSISEGLRLISNNAHNTQSLCEFHNYTSNLTLIVGYSNSH